MTVYEVKLPDGTWRHTDDLTGKEMEAIEQSTGEPWSILNPFRSLPAYRAIVGAFCYRDGMSDQDLIEWFNALTVKDLTASLRIQNEPDTPDSYQDGLPKAADEPTTGSSASS